MESDYLEKHNKLMKRWSKRYLHKNNIFIQDGIIDISRWQKSKRKILILLKEAYGDIGDLCSLIRDEWEGPKYKLWWSTSYWLYALQKISANSTPPFPTKQEQFDECSEFLLSASVVNIKKSDGKSSSDTEDILEYAKKDKKLLEEQISLINPEIILCGNTSEYFWQYWPDEIKQIGNTGYVFKTGNYIIIDYWHPANQFPDVLCYYALCAIIQDANIF